MTDRADLRPAEEVACEALPLEWGADYLRRRRIAAVIKADRLAVWRAALLQAAKLCRSYDDAYMSQAEGMGEPEFGQLIFGAGGMRVVAAALERLAEEGTP